MHGASALICRQPTDFLLPTFAGENVLAPGQGLEAMAGSPDAAMFRCFVPQRLAVLLWLSDQPNIMKDNCNVRNPSG
jgi:hypothetical protein